MGATAVERLTESEWRDRQMLKDYWRAFCDADSIPPDFTDRMEAAGLIEIRTVTASDLEDSFASERGIYDGGFIWVLTDLGSSVLASGR